MTTMTNTTTGRTVSTWNLMRAGDLQGRTVIGRNDETIGTIDDLYLDYDEHTVRYVTMDVGGFLGIGAKRVLVPFERLQWLSDRAELFLDADREAIENAPEFDPNAGYDRQYEGSVTTAWGTPSYWTADDYGTRHSHWRDRR